MENLQIIILAGGKGKRMESELPKVLTVFGNKPMIDYVVSAVEKLSLPKKPIVVIGHGSELVKNYLGERAEYAVQEKQLGTGHAVLCAKDKVCKDTEGVLVLYGDHPNTKTETIKKILSSHDEKKPILTMATVNVPNFEGFFNNFYGFGRIVRNDEGEIVKIVELRDATEEEKRTLELNPSFFCFNADWLWENLPKIKNENSQGEYYLTDLVAMAINEKKTICSVEVDPIECIGVNTKEELGRAEEIIFSDK